MIFKRSVPNQSRLSSMLLNLIKIGVPNGNIRLIYTYVQVSQLTIKNYLAFILYKLVLLLCSQRQTRTISDKIRHTTVPNRSRLLRLDHRQLATEATLIISQKFNFINAFEGVWGWQRESLIHNRK